MAALLRRRKPDKVKADATALDLARDPFRFAAGLVALGHAQAAVGGATCPTADVMRAALLAIGPAPGIQTVSSSFYMVFEGDRRPPDRLTALPPNGVLTFTDAGVVPDPTAAQLGEIAVAKGVLRTEGDAAAVAWRGLRLVELGNEAEVLRRRIDERLPWLPHRSNTELARLFEVTDVTQETTDRVRRGSPTPPKPPTAGLLRFGRPAVSPVARSGDRPQRRGQM